MYAMGFSKIQLDALFEAEPDIEDANVAVDLLDPARHKYMAFQDLGLCKICNKQQRDHRSMLESQLLE